MRANTRRRWPWAAVLLIAFALGAVAGGYAANLTVTGTQHVTDLAAMIALEEDGEPVSGGRTSGDRLSLSLYNSRDSAVTVSEVRPLGWTVDTNTERSVPPKQWTTVPFSITPDCDEEPADRVRLRVHGDGTDEQVTLRTRRGAGIAEALHSALCRQPRSTITVQDVETRRHDDELEMRLSLQLQGPPGASRTISYPAAGEVAGFNLRIVRPSLTLRSGETATVTARWTIEDCDETNPLGGTPLLAVVGAAADGPFLPNRANAALARFSAQECSASAPRG